jgi:hypothetical protein
MHARSVFTLPVARPPALCSSTLPSLACHPLLPAAPHSRRRPHMPAYHPSPHVARHHRRRPTRPPAGHRCRLATGPPGPHPRLLTTILARLPMPRAASSSTPPQPVLLHPGVPILSSSGPTPPRPAWTPSPPPAGSRRRPAATTGQACACPEMVVSNPASQTTATPTRLDFFSCRLLATI